MNKYRKINTPFFSKKAYEILNSLHIQLIDRRWEIRDSLWKNNKSYEKYWVNFTVERKDNGQVYFKVNKNHRTNVFGGEELYDNPFKKMSSAEFLNWVAAKLKSVIVAELKYESITSREGWKRNNTTFESEYLSCSEKITVADIYVVYDWLRCRQVDMDDDVVKGIFGKPRSKELIKKIKDMQSELDIIKTNRDNLLVEIDERITNLEKQIIELKELDR